jgi:hypothetical protein
MELYSRFCMNNVEPNVRFVKLIEDNVKEELTSCSEPIGYRSINP